MLEFFRRHQHYFFLVITVVIIISFSFFGTYSTLGSNTWREQIAFKAVDGSEIPRVEVDEMSLFLATDSSEKMLYGGMWGPNFLNDGVIQKNFLETGLAQQLAMAYRDDLQGDFDQRLTKEKKYVRYAHPQASFLSVENVWDYFAPEMNGYFRTLKSAQNGLDPLAFNSRVQLYLAEKRLPAPTVRYILRHQEQQYPWLHPDEKLGQSDLSLFGYHTLEDWFGTRFLNLVSEFIINAAMLAEARGYEVSKAEVIADIVHNTQLSYQQNLNSPYLGVASPEEYLSEQLRRLNLDQAAAVKIWRRILLFRRYFGDAAANALVDDMGVHRLHQFAHQNVTVERYVLPKSLELATFDDLQQFEAYLGAVAFRNPSKPLDLPIRFRSVAEVDKTYPELVQKKYELEVAQVSQKSLQARIGLRQLWNWELDDLNWKRLVQQFPILGKMSSETREERLKSLDELDVTTRSLVDAFGQKALVQSHPEWIDQALSEAKPEKMVVRLRERGGKMPFSGLDDLEKRQEFIHLIDQAPLGVPPSPDSPLDHFSADGVVYYRIVVLERASEKEILTFAEARADGTASEVRDRVLQREYAEMRKGNPAAYQNEKGEWKALGSVRDQVAAQFLQGVLTALELANKAFSEKEGSVFLSPDRLASLRLYPHVAKAKAEIEKNPVEVDRWVRVDPSTGGAADLLPVVRPPLADQWKMERAAVTYSRQNPEGLPDISRAFESTPGSWAPIAAFGNGGLFFYQIKNQGDGEVKSEEVAQQVRKAQFLLGAEAQRQLMKQVLEELKTKQALSLSYLRVPVDDQSPPQ